MRWVSGPEDPATYADVVMPVCDGHEVLWVACTEEEADEAADGGFFEFEFVVEQIGVPR